MVVGNRITKRIKLVYSYTTHHGVTKRRLNNKYAIHMKDANDIEYIWYYTVRDGAKINPLVFAEYNSVFDISGIIKESYGKKVYLKNVKVLKSL